MANTKIDLKYVVPRSLYNVTHTDTHLSGHSQRLDPFAPCSTCISDVYPLAALYDGKARVSQRMVRPNLQALFAPSWSDHLRLQIWAF